MLETATGSVSDKQAEIYNNEYDWLREENDRFEVSSGEYEKDNENGDISEQEYSTVNDVNNRRIGSPYFFPHLLLSIGIGKDLRDCARPFFGCVPRRGNGNGMGGVGDKIGPMMSVGGVEDMGLGSMLVR